jgi:Big-like domain-containing protein/centrosomal CEP192-like protein
MKMLLAVAVCLAMISSAGRCFAQTQLVSDNFDGGINGTYLGPNWAGCGYNNGAYNKLVYENNEAGGSGFWGQDCALYTGYGAFPSDQYVTATIVAPTPSTSPQASIQLRANSTPFTPEFYIACGWDAQDFPPDYHYRIWSLAPGAPGPVSLWLSSITPATNDVISCQVLGNVLTMQLNGTRVATVIDTSGNTNGYPGLYYVDPNGGSPSSNDVIFDNFAAGSGPALVSVIISPSSTTVTEGSYEQFTGIATYADGTTTNISNWSSSNTSVATVDTTGFAYAANPGTATITGASGADSGTASLTVTAANGYTPLVHDSFAGTGGGYLGPNWTGCGFDGGAYSELVYQNNQAGGSGYYAQDCSLYTGYGVFPNDQYATTTVVAPTPSSTPEASIQVRGNATPSTPEYYIACGWDAQDFPADYHYRIWSLAPNPPTGGPTSLYLSKVSPATNDVVWCQVLGTTVTMQVNGTTIATVTDTSGITGGYPGLYYIDPNGDVPPSNDVIFDNFVAGRIDGSVLASIAITPNPASVTAGSYVQFTATGTYTDGSTANISSSVSWSSSNTSVATVSASGLAYGASTGTVTITGSSGTTSSGASLTVNAALAPTVTFTGAPANAPYNGTFTVTATTNAPVMPTITGTTGVCSVGTVTGTPASASAVVTMLTGTGTCTMTANWAATTNYTAAGPLTQTTTATKLAPTVTFTGAPASAVYNTGFSVTATTNASTMPQITGTANVCTVGAVTGTPASASAGVTMIRGTGTCTVTSTWAADANYSAPAANTQSTTAVKAVSTVTITSNTPNPSTLKQAVTISFTAAGTGAGPTGSVRVTASTNESCTRTLTSAHTGTCSITFSTAGSRTLTASYAGDSNFNGSTSASVSQTVNSPTVSLSPSSINFGNVTRGSTQTQAETVTNTGTGALINFSWSITGTNANRFTVSSTTCGRSPATLNPGASCVINVTFKPTTTGTQTANLKLTDNATNSPQTVGLSGSGQ